jgi:hypothetical protein
VRDIFLPQRCIYSVLKTLHPSSNR